MSIRQAIDCLPPAHRVPLHDGEVVRGPEDVKPRLQDDDHSYDVVTPFMGPCGKVCGIYIVQGENPL